MNLTELKEKLLEYSNPEWYDSITEIFEFPPLGLKNTFVGVTSIFEYVDKQANGWEKLKLNLPSQLNDSSNYFRDIRELIINYVKQISSNDNNYLQNNWSNIHNRIANRGPFVLPYNIPEVQFLIELNIEFPESFDSAFNFLVSSSIGNINNVNAFKGAILAYEFILKDKSSITKRRIAEENSISNLRNDFLDYISTSEAQLNKHLENSNLRFKEYATLIDDLKIEKEKLFSEWFQNANKEYIDFSSASTSKVNELETTYEEMLRLKKPAEYWKLRAVELNKEGWKSLYWLIGLTSFGCLALYVLLWLTPEGMLTSIFSDNKNSAIRWSIVFITFISFIAFAIRSLMKVTFSSFHLARDAEERERLTFVYLAMIKDSSMEKEDRQLIMQSLFSRADTGLLKDDSSPTMPGYTAFFDKANK